MLVQNRADNSLFRLLQSVIASLVFGTLVCGSTLGGPTHSPGGAELYFVDLKDGATIPTKVVIRFGLRGMGIAPAAEDRENTGHHHLLIDADLPSLDQPILNDANHLHFDAGETEAEITLAPGTHTLQLLLGDKDHIAHNPPVMSLRIRVVAREGGAAPAATATPSAQRQTVPSSDALPRRIPEILERYMPDRFPDPRDFRR
jgi:Domain of unknown function (DUF4399)